MEYYLREKFELYFAKSGQHAIEQLNHHVVDIILLDISIEGDENGIDLLKGIRNHEKWKNIPVIATTAHAQDSQKTMALAAGCNDYMIKPIKREYLFENIMRHIKIPQ